LGDAFVGQPIFTKAHNLGIDLLAALQGTSDTCSIEDPVDHDTADAQAFDYQLVTQSLFTQSNNGLITNTQVVSSG
jgi:hypothetical protein